MRGNVKGYKAIAAEANRLNWPELWTTDLTTHDYEMLTEFDAPREFGWSIRRCGTDLYRVGDEWSIGWLKSHIKYMMGRDIRYYFYDGSTLCSLPADELLRVLQKGVPDD